MLIEVTAHKHEGFICGTAEFNIKTLQQSFWETNITKQTPWHTAGPRGGIKLKVA